MSDYFAAEIEIGGKIASHLVPDLLTAIHDSGAGLEYGEGLPANTDLPGLVNENGTILLKHDQACYGEFEDLEATCRELGLTYVRKSDGKYEFDPEIVWWSQDMAEPGHCLSDKNNEPVVHQSRIKPIISLLEEGKTVDAMVALRSLIAEIPDVPKLEVIDG